MTEPEEVKPRPFDHCAVLSRRFRCKKKSVRGKGEVKFIAHNAGLYTYAASRGVDLKNASKMPHSL